MGLKQTIDAGYNGDMFRFSTEGQYCLAPENIGRVDIARGSKTFRASPSVYLSFGLDPDNARIVEVVIDHRNFPNTESLLLDLDNFSLDDLIQEDNQIIAVDSEGLKQDVVATILQHLHSFFGHLNFVDITQLTRSDVATQMKVIDNFFVGKLNLKEREFRVIKQIQDRQGRVCVVGDFNEDINGSSLDGSLPARSCAIIPKEKVKHIDKGSEQKKHKGGEQKEYRGITIKDGIKANKISAKQI